MNIDVYIHRGLTEPQVTGADIAEAAGGPPEPNMIVARHVESLTPEQRAHFDANRVPSCFSRQQWERWRTYARGAPVTPIDGYCEDCTREYQQQMIQDGRCRYPGTVFLNDRGYRVFWADGYRARYEQQKTG